MLFLGAKMTDGFEMAEALVAWARRRFKEIAPHQYESFQSRKVATNFRIAIKEIFDHLRAALDYCARRVCEAASGGPLAPGDKAYFPIVAVGSRPEDFRSRVGKLLPGVVGARDDLVAVFGSFQEFADPKANAWLPAFATLCNENKHERLSLQREVMVPGKVEEHEGTPVYVIGGPDTPPMGKGFRACFLRDPWAPGNYTVLYFRFDAVNYEVESFLEVALDGVEGIVRELKAKV